MSALDMLERYVAALGASEQREVAELLNHARQEVMLARSEEARLRVVVSFITEVGNGGMEKIRSSHHIWTVHRTEQNMR
jgi:hypothetical protein